MTTSIASHFSLRKRMVVSINQLLSTCVYANLEACEIIRKYHCNLEEKQSKRNKEKKKVDDGETTKHHLKEEGDPRSVVTQADIDAQCKIMDILRLQTPWGKSIRIIGEEDVSNDETQIIQSSKESKNAYEDSMREEFSKELAIKQKGLDGEVPIDELTIFIDPLDGTREFVEKRIENVGCLIGITRNGKAIAGTIGVPFPSANDKDKKPFLHYALLSFDDKEEDHIHGMWPLHPETNTDKSQPIPREETDNNLIILTGDSKNRMLADAVNHMKNIASSSTVDHKILGGTAAKLSSVATKNASSPSIAILHSATCVWDTVATEALVRATGGKVTDFLGNPLVTHSSYNINVQNIHGVIASSKEANDFHIELCERIQKDAELVDRIMPSSKI